MFLLSGQQTSYFPLKKPQSSPLCRWIFPALLGYQRLLASSYVAHRYRLEPVACFPHTFVPPCLSRFIRMIRVTKPFHHFGCLSFFGVSVDNSAANLFRSFVRLVSRVLFSFFKSSIFPSIIPPASVLDGLRTKCFQVRMSPLKIPQYWFRLVQLLHQCEYPVSEGPKCCFCSVNSNN